MLSSALGEERQVKRQAEPSVTVGPEGVALTPFVNEICLQEDLEVSLVSLPVTVCDIRFPMCLVAASVGRHKAVRPRTDGIPAWPLRQVPSAMLQCSVEMPFFSTSADAVWAECPGHH